MTNWLISLRAHLRPAKLKVGTWSYLRASESPNFWDATFPHPSRAEFKWQQLFDAPVIAIAFADADAYVRRYGEADKKSTGLGDGPEAWPTPYWTVDASFAVMTLLFAAQDAGLGALFFAVFNGAEEVRRLLGVPEHLQLIGALALGWPLETSTSNPDSSRGVSASRRRRNSAEIIHRQKW